MVVLRLSCHVVNTCYILSKTGLYMYIQYTNWIYTANGDRRLLFLVPCVELSEYNFAKFVLRFTAMSNVYYAVLNAVVLPHRVTTLRGVVSFLRDSQSRVSCHTRVSSAALEKSVLFLYSDVQLVYRKSVSHVMRCSSLPNSSVRGCSGSSFLGGILSAQPAGFYRLPVKYGV